MNKALLIGVVTTTLSSLTLYGRTELSFRQAGQTPGLEDSFEMREYSIGPKKKQSPRRKHKKSVRR